MELAFLSRRNRFVRRRHREKTAHQRQLLLVGCQRRELPRDEEIGRSSEQAIARLRQLHDDHRLFDGKLSLFSHQRFHRAGFFGRHDVVGVGDAPEQVGKGGQIAGALGLEMVERVERFTKRDDVLRFGSIQSQPAADRLQGHVRDLLRHPLLAAGSSTPSPA